MRKFYAIDPNDPGTGGTVATPIATLPTTPVPPINASAPTSVAPLPISKSAIGTPAANPNLIPRLNYNDPASHTSFINNWQKQYGNLEGRGDTLTQINQIPRGGSDTIKNIATKYGKQYGIDPALLYSSEMEEGASGLFKNLNGTDTKGRKPGDFGYQDYYGDKDFPINGGQSFGFQTFAQRFPDLVKKGYLPQSFASIFRGVKAALADTDETHDANNFKTADAATQAKAAMLKYHYDDIDSYAKQRNITLSPKARDFFALAEYNGGEGTGHQMLNDYYNNGYLKDDKFLQARPTSGASLKPSSYKDVYDHVNRRLVMAGNLKEQQMID
jgi:hypothetical protein